MRPAHLLLLVLLALGSLDLALYLDHARRLEGQGASVAVLTGAVSALGLSDLCLSTEARYTRHPAASDAVAPFMDHPGALEHFPTGTFFAPPAPRNGAGTP